MEGKTKAKKNEQMNDCPKNSIMDVYNAKNLHSYLLLVMQDCWIAFRVIKIKPHKWRKRYFHTRRRRTPSWNPGNRQDLESKIKGGMNE